MSAPEDLAAAVQALAARVADLAGDPAERVRLLRQLVDEGEAASAGPGPVGAAMDAMQRATAGLCRRAALVSMARAAAASQPPSYDEAVALRDLVCGLLDAEVLRAGDQGEDAAGQALRTLRTALAEDLSRRAADLARLRDVRTPAAMPALVMAYRLYADIGRRDQLAAYAGAADPGALPLEYRALDR